MSMMIGLALSPCNVLGVGSWYPTTLFGAGEAGFIVDVARDGAAFQESTGGSATTPSGNGDPIGSLKDYSPNNTWFTSLTTARPTLVVDGSVKYISPDGSNDYLQSAHAFSSAALYVAAAFRPQVVVGYERIVSLATASTADYDNAQTLAAIMRNSGASSWLTSRAFTDSAAIAIAANEDAVLEVGHTATTMLIAKNGGSDSTSSHADFGSFSTSICELLHSAGVVSEGFAKSRLYAAIAISRIPDASERANIVSWLMTKAGLSSGGSWANNWFWRF